MYSGALLLSHSNLDIGKKVLETLPLLNRRRQDLCGREHKAVGRRGSRTQLNGPRKLGLGDIGEVVGRVSGLFVSRQLESLARYIAQGQRLTVAYSAAHACPVVKRVPYDWAM